MISQKKNKTRVEHEPEGQYYRTYALHVVAERVSVSSMASHPLSVQLVLCFPSVVASVFVHPHTISILWCVMSGIVAVAYVVPLLSMQRRRALVLVARFQNPPPHNTNACGSPFVSESLLGVVAQLLTLCPPFLLANTNSAGEKKIQLPLACIEEAFHGIQYEVGIFGP